jgi:hypothetical protein
MGLEPEIYLHDRRPPSHSGAGRLGTVAPLPEPEAPSAAEGRPADDDATSVSPCNTTPVSPCNTTPVSPYPLESDSLESKPFDSPPTPRAEKDDQSAATAAVPSGKPASGLSKEGSALEPGGSLVGEIIDPLSATFDDFWRASGQSGLLGPALGAWKKLQTADRAAIAEIVRRDGAVDTDGIWASTWLGCRGWEWSPRAKQVQDLRSRRERRYAQARDNVCARLGIARSDDAGMIPDPWHAHRALVPPSVEQVAEQALANGAAVLRAYSDEWWSARKAAMTRGQSVYVMDQWAQHGKGWPVIDG